MDKYLDSGSSARGKASSTTAPRNASKASSRLNTLLTKTKARPASSLDVGVIDGLSVAGTGGGPAAKRSKGPSSRRGSSGGGGSSGDGAVDSNASDCLDVSSSPPRGAPTPPTRTSRAGGGAVSNGLGARFGSNSRGGSGGDRVADLAGSNRSTGGGDTRSAAAAGSGRGGGGGSNNSNGRSSWASSKMGSWIRRPAERAICAEDGYDPLELMGEANQELFGNDAFRGVQEEVSQCDARASFRFAAAASYELCDFVHVVVYVFVCCWWWCCRGCRCDPCKSSLAFGTSTFRATPSHRSKIRVQAGKIE